MNTIMAKVSGVPVPGQIRIRLSVEASPWRCHFPRTCNTEITGLWCATNTEESSLKSKNFELQDIKLRNISEEELTELKKLVGSYEALFSKIARKYKELNLKDASLTEEQMKHYILDDYTFLKRPVILFGNHIFIGNAKATIENAKNTIKN